MMMWKRAVAATLAGIGLAAGAPAADDARPAVLQPTGTWRVEYSQNMCVLAHQFGVGPAEVTFALRPLPLGEKDEVVMISRSTKVSPDVGEATVTLQPGDATIDAHYESVTVKGDPSRVTTMYIQHDKMGDLARAAEISLKAGKNVDATIAPPNTKAALAALQTCQDDLLRSWGIDPSMQSKIAVRAKSDLARSVTTDNYPARAFDFHEEGKATAVYVVGLNGKATGCRIVISSHSSSLDEATCLAVSRARFTPAIGLDGRPMASTEATSINWRIIP
jgi:TonB family protein